MRRKYVVAVLTATAAIVIFSVALAQAASAPTASTGNARDVTGSAATLHGQVNPNGEATTYSFQ